MDFATGMPSKDPAEMRFNFHPKKGGLGLPGERKGAVPAKKSTFGPAGGEAFALAQGVADVSPKTL